MEIVIKVNRQQVKDPAAHVTSVIRRVWGERAPNVRAEEIFPDVHTGRSAGLVSLELPDGLTPDDSEEILRALREDDSIEYANLPPRRSVK